jgi:hypothetical protein
MPLSKDTFRFEARIRTGIFPSRKLSPLFFLKRKENQKEKPLLNFAISF